MVRNYGARTGRVQNPRSVLAGKRPDFLKGGVIAVNLTDKRVWVGDLSDEAVVFSTRIEEFDATKGYLVADIVIRGGELFYALRDKVAGEPFQAADWGQLTASTRTEVADPYATSLTEGGTVSKHADTQVSVTAGSGVIVDNTAPDDISYTRVTWAAFTAALTPPVSGWQYVAIQSTGAIVSGPLEDLTPEQRRSVITLGVVRWNSTGMIETVYDIGYAGGGTAESFRDLYNAEGGAFRSQGLDVEAGAGLQLRVTAGTAFALGWNSDPRNPNLIDHPSATDPVTFTIASQSDNVATGVTDLDPTSYDNGGVVTPIPAGQATIQYVYASPDLSTVYVQLGQTLYGSVEGASASLEQDWGALVGKFDPPLVSFAAICIASDATDLSEAIIVKAARRSVDPYSNQVALQDGAYFYLDGSRPMEGNINLGGNSLTNGDISGGTSASRDVALRARRSEASGDIPADAGPGDEGELFANIKDRRLYVRDSSGAMTVLADRIDLHNITLVYGAGDFCIYDNTIYRAEQANGPGVFDPADWQSMSATVTDVVVKAPSAPGQNTITPVASTVEGLVIEPNPSQAVPLLDVAGALVKADGFANYRFGPSNFRRAQTTHPFSSVGQAASFDSGIYQRADASRAEGKAYGIVEEIIDADTVVIRTGGRMEGLDAASFTSGSIVPGTLYYVSTTPGLLTDVPPTTPDRVDPVLLADSTTSGIVVVDSGISDASDRVSKLGDVMTGDLRMEAAKVIIEDTSQGLDTKRWRIENDAAHLELQPESDAGVALAGGLSLSRSSVGMVDGLLDVSAAANPLALPEDKSVVNRERLYEFVRDIVYPIGILLESTVNVDPATYLPGTTWAPFGEGRVTVGVGSNGESTWTSGETRGSEVHTLTEAELPAHVHNVDPPEATTSTDGDHVHTSSTNLLAQTGSNKEREPGPDNEFPWKNLSEIMDPAGAHNHTLDIAPFDSATTGGGGPHANLQPSVAVYRWTRTA